MTNRRDIEIQRFTRKLKHTPGRGSSSFLAKSEAPIRALR
jgi:hypothetical protein